MPTYEYRCDKCKKKFEIVQSIKAKALRKCPKCSGSVKRLISSGAGILFKGSGFYHTDYRSSKYKEAAKKEQPAAPAPKASSEGSPKQAKPAEKTKKAS